MQTNGEEANPVLTITTVESVVTVSPTAAESPTQLITFDPAAATSDQSRLFGPVMTIDSPTSNTSKDSSDGPDIGLIVGLIVGFAIVIGLLLYLIFRLKQRQAARGDQIQSPLPSEYDNYRDSTKIEAIQEPKHRTRSLIEAFPLPPGSDAGSVNGPHGASPSPFSDFAAVNHSSVGVGLRKKKPNAPVPDRRSVVSWFSIKSRRKSGFAHRKPSGFEWYRSGVDDSVEVEDSREGRESAMSVAPPVEMFERCVKSVA